MPRRRKLPRIERGEQTYWASKLGVPERKLRKVAEEVGPDPERIERRLVREARPRQRSAR